MIGRRPCTSFEGRRCTECPTLLNMYNPFKRCHTCDTAYRRRERIDEGRIVFWLERAEFNGQIVDRGEVALA